MSDQPTLSVVLTAPEGQTGHLIADLLLTNPDFKSKISQLTLLTANPDHEHVQSLVKSGAKAVKATTKDELLAAMQEAKPNAAMLIPPSSADKLKEVTMILEVMKEAGGVENAIMLSSAGADLADEKLPRLREFVEMEKLAMETLKVASVIRYVEN